MAPPLKLCPQIVLEFWSVVAVVAFPESAAVIVPAVKLPLPSRATIVLTVFKLVALEVIVGLPETPSALDTLKPVPDTAILRAATVPEPVLTIMPFVPKLCKASA